MSRCNEQMYIDRLGQNYCKKLIARDDCLVMFCGLLNLVPWRFVSHRFACVVVRSRKNKEEAETSAETSKEEFICQRIDEYQQEGFETV